MKKELSFFIALIGQKVTRKLTGRNIVPVINTWVIDSEATAKQCFAMQKYGYEFTEAAQEPAAKVEEPAAKVEEPAATEDPTKTAAKAILNSK